MIKMFLKIRNYTMSSKIFIQIASYRDNQLNPTIRDLMDNAMYPENLVFCIAWQHSPEDQWDNLSQYKEDQRFRIIDINSKDSQGVCWARNQIQQLYQDEEYTLQIDSHHRFIKHWDHELIQMYKGALDKGHEKPLFTTYLPSFDPLDDPGQRVQVPWKLDFDRFTPEGVVFFLPSNIPGYETLREPIACRFYSAHFCFTGGKFCTEVPHDPAYYFHGEEISIAVRAFTHGYTLMTPHKIIAWHEYTRRYRKKHWDDHSDWATVNKLSHLRLRKLLGVDGIVNDIDFGPYGLGTVRSLGDYERYAGIEFKTRGVQQYTLDHSLPPNPPLALMDPYLYVFKHCIDIHCSELPYDDYKFIAVIFETRDNQQLFRQDVVENELRDLMAQSGDFYQIWRSFTYTDQIPYRYVVWPFSEKHGWCKKMETVIYGS